MSLVKGSPFSVASPDLSLLFPPPSKDSFNSSEKFNMSGINVGEENGASNFLLPFDLLPLEGGGWKALLLLVLTLEPEATRLYQVI